MDEFAPPTAAERADALRVLLEWLSAIEADHEVVDAVVEDTDFDGDRWFVRVLGDTKDVYSVWFTLGQRTLAYETYVMPAPDENHAEFYEQLLRRNNILRELAFSIGEEHAVFLRGQLDLRSMSPPALDRILGSVYAAIELYFVPALRIGFASRFDAN